MDLEDYTTRDLEIELSDRGYDIIKKHELYQEIYELRSVYLNCSEELFKETLYEFFRKHLDIL